VLNVGTVELIDYVYSKFCSCCAKLSTDHHCRDMDMGSVGIPMRFDRQKARKKER